MGKSQRKIVIVSGAPGSGKTTLAVPLAAALGYPLFSKDFIKETLTDVLGGNSRDLSTSRRIGGAAMELLWSLAQHAPNAVLEANFRPHSAYERNKIEGLGAKIVEVYCDCGSQETARRFADRAVFATHHPAHPLKELPPELLAEYDQPLQIGQLIKVDTRGPTEVNALAAEVLRSFGQA